MLDAAKLCGDEGRAGLPSGLLNIFSLPVDVGIQLRLVIPIVG
jgi:hypothetical protein